jgi:hypothetical protein
MRTAAVLLMLAGAAAQSTLGSTLGAGVLALGIHGRAHAHSVSLESDGNHLDVVLSHAAPHPHDHPASFSEGDHVIHIAAGDVASAMPRRVLVDTASAVAISIALPGVVAPAWAPLREPAPSAHRADHLRTVVLRI